MTQNIQWANELEMNRILINLFGGNRVLKNNVKLLQNNVVIRGTPNKNESDNKWLRNLK